MATEQQEEKVEGESPGLDHYSFKVMDMNVDGNVFGNDDYIKYSAPPQYGKFGSPILDPGVQYNPPDPGRLLIISTEHGNYVMTAESFSHVSSDEYRNSVVFDPSNMTTVMFDDDGMLYDNTHFTLDEFEGMLKGMNNFRDYYTNEDLTHLVIPYVGQSSKETSQVEAPIESTISPEGLQLLRVNPPLYKELCKKNIINKENIEEVLLGYVIFNPDEIPEVFTVIEKEPYSDVLKDYLDTLAVLISEAMDKDDEIDNIEALEEEAYKKSGCRDSIENVRVKQKEFQDYFKYRLIKDEKYCITKDVYNHICSIGKSMSESNDVQISALKFLHKDKVFFRKVFTKPDANRIGMRACVDVVKLDGMNKCIKVNMIKKIDANLEDFPDMISKLGLDITMAMYSEVVEHEFKHLIDKKQTVKYNFIVVDKNDLHYIFEVKAGTFAKWKKKLGEQMNRADWHIKNDNFKLPYEFMNNNMSI